MASTPIRGLTPRGGRGRGSRGGRRPRAPKILTPPNSTVSQQNLAMLAQAINHQQGKLKKKIELKKKIKKIEKKN